jgi:uncharacterized protein (DUF1015 family)
MSIRGADLAPFPALRYDAARVGGLEQVITQPYDKISPAMLERYHRRSSYNLARVVKNANYAEAAANLDAWKREGVLRHDPRPAFYPYVQEYAVPDTGEKLTRKALVGALKLTDYAEGVVLRHELTMRGPKQDRLELMRATRLHCELIFLVHEDPDGEIAGLLDRAVTGAPVESLHDDFGDRHSVWRTDDPALIALFRDAFANKRLLIADGHHRYETMLAYHKEHPAADRILVALVSMDAPGLTILPTHRLLSHMVGFSHEKLLRQASRFFEITETTRQEGRAMLARNIIGLHCEGHPGMFLLHLKSPTDLAALLPDLTPAQRRLDVVLLHELLLRLCLGIGAEATREQENLEYIREFDKGWEGVEQGAQACFFLHPVAVSEVRDIAYQGGVMPQKSTDFYPKMLSGLAMYETG